MSLLVRRVLVLVACALPLRANAQDRRHLVEPHVPPACRTLEATIALSAGGLAEADDHPGDTARIQSAINACPPGSSVELRPRESRTAFVTGPLELRAGVFLSVASGAILFASRDPRDYDVAPGRCGTVDDAGGGCRAVIHVAAQNSGIVGEGVIDGRGGAVLRGAAVSWWDLAEQARTPPRHQNVPRLIVAERADNFTLYRITLRNSANFHVVVSRTTGFTAWGVRIDTPANARNTDGIDPSSSSDVSIVHCSITTGDDNVAIKAGDAGPASHITVTDNHFYSGHGMSIGSETNGGVSSVEVRGLTIDGADNGLRIKSNPSRGGAVRDVTYEDVCMRNVRNPLVFDSFYDKVAKGALVPWFDPIRLKDVRITGGGTITVTGADRDHAVGLFFDGLTLTGKPITAHASDASVTLGPGAVDVDLAGPNVNVSRVPGNRPVPSCDGRFVPFSQP